ncbi:MAG: hypothetical protein J6M02_04085 [Clostridia bacterium]|nr:hypothetical protein [Clostridia bacterium]
MAIVLNLISEKENTIQNFLESYFEKDMLADSQTYEWSYTLPEPLEAINLISAVLDNNLKDLTLWISFDPNVFLKVKPDNYNDIIKYIVERFSKAS